MKSVLGLLLGGLLVTGAQAVVIDNADITHTAETGGDWFDPSTWDNGVPGDGDTALIPAGIQVDYAGASPDTLYGVRVDGTLTFSPTATSELVLDTLEIEHTGELVIGTADNPVSGSVSIRFVSDSDIDTITDPDLLSRGLVAGGPITIHGRPKTVHAKVAVDPLAGDDTLTMAAPPENWQVGDTLVITGTRYSGWKWDNDVQAVIYHGTQDEVVTITSVSGSQVIFDPPLAYDHASPRTDLKASVANFSRTVTFSTINGDSVPVHRRGHVMFRHHNDVDVRYAAFHQLGRTDKSAESFNAADLGTLVPDDNIRGRYAFHFHRSGIDDPADPGIAIGNAVFNSPGWGYVHHDSNAVFHNNASFETFGAGFVAETGNEIGAWTDNIAIKAQGNSAFNPKNGNDPETFDMGRTGDGFWFQGRMVRSVGNIAASVNHGFVYLHRGSGMLGFPNSAFSLPEALRRQGLASPDDAPILNFHDNESYASTVGLYVVKANPNQQHDIHSHFSNFTAWEVQAGSAMEYTSHYLLENFDIIGSTPEPFRLPLFGIEFGTNTTDMVINNTHIRGMETGVILAKDFTDPVPPEANQYVTIDVTFDEVDTDYEFYDPNIDTLMTGGDLTPGQFGILINGGPPYEYLSPATSAGSGVDYIGTKTDSIGPTPIPAGTDAIGTPSYDMIAICETDGYYRAADNTPYAVVEEFFTDRATGEIHKFGLITLLGPDVDALLGDPFHAWGDAFQRGLIDLASQPPVAVNDTAQTAPETEVIIDVLGNDSDPDGDVLTVDGVVQPDHGMVFDNGDGTLTYRPDFDYLGADTFRYWAYDDNGHYAPAEVIVEVAGSYVFADGFEN